MNLQSAQDVHQIVARRAGDRPIGRKRLVARKDFFCDDVDFRCFAVPVWLLRTVKRVQMLEIIERIVKAVRMIYPQSGDPTCSDQSPHEPMNGFEHARILNANRRQIVDVEKPPVIDLVRRDSPVSQPVPLLLQQSFQLIEAFRISCFAVDIRNGRIEGRVRLRATPRGVGRTAGARQAARGSAPPLTRDRDAFSAAGCAAA